MLYFVISSSVWCCVTSDASCVLWHVCSKLMNKRNLETYMWYFQILHMHPPGGGHVLHPIPGLLFCAGGRIGTFESTGFAFKMISTQPETVSCNIDVPQVCPDQLALLPATIAGRAAPAGFSFDTQPADSKAKQDTGCQDTANSQDYISISESCVYISYNIPTTIAGPAKLFQWGAAWKHFWLIEGPIT